MSKESTSTGIGFSGLLTIAFIVLKLTKVIDWSWWWVLSPTWITALLYVVLASIGVYAIYIDDKNESKRQEALERYYEQNPHLASKKSKFMQKLEEAMAESEKRKKQNMN